MFVTSCDFEHMTVVGYEVLFIIGSRNTTYLLLTSLHSDALYKVSVIFSQPANKDGSQLVVVAFLMITLSDTI